MDRFEYKYCFVVVFWVVEVVVPFVKDVDEPFVVVFEVISV